MREHRSLDYQDISENFWKFKFIMTMEERTRTIPSKFPIPRDSWNIKIPTRVADTVSIEAAIGTLLVSLILWTPVKYIRYARAVGMIAYPRPKNNNFAFRGLETECQGLSEIPKKRLANKKL